LPALHLRLHAPLTQLGLLFAANFAGSLVATLGVGPLLDRYAARPMLVLGVLCMAVGMLALPFASSLRLPWRSCWLSDWEAVAIVLALLC